MNAIVERMAKAVRWRERQLDNVLVAAERAANALWRKGLPLEDFLMLGGAQNPYAAILLLEQLAKSGQIGTEEAGRQRVKMAEVCREDLKRVTEEADRELLKGTAAMQADREAAVTQADKGAAAAQTMPPFIYDDIVLLCAAALVLEDRELLYAALELFKRLGTMEESADFSRRIFGLLRHAPSELSCQVRLYRAFYDCLSIEWNQRIAYTQGVEVLVPEALPEELRALVLQAVDDGQLRYADLVLKLFLPVHLSQLGMTGEAFMEKVFCTDNDTLFRGILFAEKMILQDAPSFLEGVEQWRAALLAKCREGNRAWQGVKEWFDMYYLCRRITACPQEAGAFLEAYAPMKPYAAQYQKTNSVQQEAFEALFLMKDKSILRLLAVLGENNVFRFQSEEEYFPHFEKNPSYSLTAAVRSLLEQGLTPKEMMYVYMNTHLRSCYYISAFLRLVFADGEGLEIRGTEASVQGYFAPYRLTGRVEKWEKGYGFSSQNICMGSRLILFPIDWQRENGEFCRRMREEGTTLSFHVTRMNMNSYSLRGIPDGSPAGGEAGDDGEIFDRLCRELEEIGRTAELTTEQNGRISRMAVSGELNEEQRLRLGRRILDGCAALKEKPKQLRYFVNMLNHMGNGRMNPWRHQVSRKENGWQPQEAEMVEAARDCFKSLKASPLSPEELFFVYINTPLKYCVSFSTLVESRCPETGVVNLDPMLSGWGRYFFSGRILSVQPDRRPGSGAWFVSVLPDEFYRGPKGRWDTFYLKTEEADGYVEGLGCQFEISAYHAGRKSFFVKNIIHKQDLRSCAPRQIFLAAMNRAAYTERLSFQDMGDLNVQVENLNSRDAGKLVLPMINALKKRAYSITAVNKYLTAIERSNPWRFGEGPIPDRQSWPEVIQGENIREACQRLLSELAGRNELRAVLRTYFNTVIKSYVGLDTALSECRNAGRELSSLPLWMKEYPLTVEEKEGRLRPVNFALDGNPADCWREEGAPEEGKQRRRFLTGFEERTKTLLAVPGRG